VVDTIQEGSDRFYWKNGPCCAGCDWWQAISPGAGDCTKAAPVSGDQRAVMLGIESCSLPIGAGHPITKRSHHCGDFKDDFKWTDLPLVYRRRVGCPV